jgi:flagellar M-ring protein FliF
MNFLQKVLGVWRNVNIVQRALLIAITLTLGAVVFFFARWVQKPDLTLLYSDLDPADASKIVDKISEKNISYELRGGGTSVYVPKDKVYQLRLDMAKEGLPAGTQNGYKLFDDEKIGISPFVQNVNLQRALQDELAKSIQMIDGILFCRVHIVSGEQSVFVTEKSRTTASVVLKLKAGFRLSSFNIAAITHLVSGSVDGLKPENVTLVDSEGRLLSNQSDDPAAAGAATVHDYRERVEQNLAEKAEKMLTAVLGPGRAIVRVSAVVDMTSVNMVTETYDPLKKVSSKEEITSNSEAEAGTPAPAGQTAAPGGTKKDETIVTEYKVGKTVEQKVELPGQIKSLSVAAFVDLTADANSAAAGGTGRIMEVADVEQIIKNALGLKDTDALKVVLTKFHQPEKALISEEPKRRFDLAAIIRNASLAIAAVCALLVLKIFSGAKKKKEAAEGAAVAPRMLGTESAEGGPGYLSAGSETGEPVMVRRQISSALRNNPDEVKKLFASWVQEQGER